MSFLYGRASYRWVILFACILGYCASSLVRWNYTAITKYLSGDFGIGKVELGILASAFFYAYAVTQVLWGALTDLCGARRVIAVGTGLMGFALAGFAISSTFTEAVVWRVVAGFVAASAYVPVATLLSRWFSIKERGLVMEVYNGVGGGLGELLAFWLLPALALLAGNGFFGLATWRSSTILMGGVLILMAIVCAMLLRSDPSEIGLPSLQAQDEKGKGKTYKGNIMEAIKDPAFWVVAVVWCAYIIAPRLIVSWVPMYATEYFMYVQNMPKETAMVAGGAMATFYVWGRGISSPFVGALSDYLLHKHQIPRSIMLFGGLVGLAGVFCTYSTVIPTLFWLGALACFGGLFVNLYGLVPAVVAEIWSIRSSGFNMGLVNTIGQIAGAISLTASGFFAAKFAIKDGAFYTGFLGIWYLGIAAMVVGAIAGFFIILREKRAINDNISSTKGNSVS